VTVTWTNNDDYDSITLSGVDDPPAIAPDAESVTLTLPSGSYTLVITAAKGENSGELSCGVDIELLCPDGIACTVDGTSMTATWTNNDTYTEIEIHVDGQVGFAFLDGDATSFTADDLTPGEDHEICVFASDEGGTCDELCVICYVPVLFVRGDVNVDAKIDIADPVKLLQYLFAQDSVDCLDACDTNDDGEVNISDPIKLLDYIFGGEVLPAPNECGPDEDEEDPDLGCESFDPCML
jgi:hypothetical protein